MTEFMKLPVYNAARTLYVALNESTGKVPRNQKFMHVNPLFEKVEKVMTLVALINNTHENDEKIEYVGEAIREIMILQISVRNLHELKLITVKGYGNIANKSEMLVRQLVGWKKSFIKGSASESSVSCHEESTMLSSSEPLI